MLAHLVSELCKTLNKMNTWQETDTAFSIRTGVLKVTKLSDVIPTAETRVIEGNFKYV